MANNPNYTCSTETWIEKRSGCSPVICSLVSVNAVGGLEEKFYYFRIWLDFLVLVCFFSNWGSEGGA